MAATLTTTAPPVLDAVSHFAGREHKLLIGGQWVPAASGKTFPVDNPANGELIAHVADGGKEDIDRAVKAARGIREWPVAAHQAGRPDEDDLEAGRLAGGARGRIRPIGNPR